MCNIVVGQTQLEICPKGTYSVNGGNECMSSPPGFMSTTPSEVPTPCSDGYYSTTVNST